MTGIVAMSGGAVDVVSAMELEGVGATASRARTTCELLEDGLVNLARAHTEFWRGSASDAYRDQVENLARDMHYALAEARQVAAQASALLRVLAEEGGL